MRTWEHGVSKEGLLSHDTMNTSGSALGWCQHAALQQSIAHGPRCDDTRESYVASPSVCRSEGMRAACGAGSLCEALLVAGGGAANSA
eukprot:1320521-Prymnesium_polylepis.1